MTEPIYRGVHRCSFRTHSKAVQSDEMTVYEYGNYYFGLRQISMSFDVYELSTGLSIMNTCIPLTLSKAMILIVSRREDDRFLSLRIDAIKEHGRLNTRLIKRLKGAK